MRQQLGGKMPKAERKKATIAEMIGRDGPSNSPGSVIIGTEPRNVMNQQLLLVFLQLCGRPDLHKALDAIGSEHIVVSPASETRSSILLLFSGLGAGSRFSGRRRHPNHRPPLSRERGSATDRPKPRRSNAAREVTSSGASNTKRRVDKIIGLVSVMLCGQT